jgi:hypothetical protein
MTEIKLNPKRQGSGCACNCNKDMSPPACHGHLP